MRLSELLAMPALRMRLVTAEAADPELGWPHITDVPDPGPYLTGGELVLTAGVWHDGPASSERFVGALAQRGACGIVFGITPPHAMRTPDDLIEACGRASLPLMEVPREVPFVAICKAIAADAAERHEAPLRAAVRRNEHLVAAAGHGGPHAILAVLAREPGLAPFLVDRHARVVVPGPSEPTVAEAEAAAALVRAGAARVAESEPVPGQRQVAFAVAGMGSVEHRLVCRVSRAELTAEQHAAVAQTVAFLELEMAREHALHATEARFAAELLEIVRAGSRRAEEARARLASFGLASDRPIAVLVIRASGCEPDRSSLAEELRTTLAARGLDAVVAEDADVAVAFVSLPAGAPPPGTLARELVGVLERADFILHVGVGRTAPAADQLRRSLLEAWHACDLARRHATASVVATHRDIGSHRFLWALHDDEVRQGFRAQLLDPLLEYDAQRGGELVRTLEVFLGSCGQWQATAQELTIHVNTLRHRLHRVEELTGRSLSRMEDRVDFFLALRGAA